MRLLVVLSLLLPLSSGRPRIVVQVSTHARVIALTFDAGADRGYAPSILQTLERNHVRASFGMTGSWALANPDLIRRIARDGDQFINHTFDHRSFTGFSSRSTALSLSQRTWEIERTDAIIYRLTGRRSKPYFRPPYGDYDTATLDLLHRLGYDYMVMWTLDSLGWEHLAAPTIIVRCRLGIHPGTILLMHVGSQSQDAVALPTIISSLRRQRYSFLTVQQLVERH